MLSDRLDPQKHDWLKSRGLMRIVDAVAAGGGEARVVGGAVRDSLLGHEPHEIDLAVNLPPEKVIELLAKAGIKTVPTGIDHGTVTAVVDHKGYEITTLRHDIETDGRRAKVAFTDDWQADAGRRDFTMNALYTDASGKIYDYFDGRADLAAGHVRFIGDASARIKEDILRILRFFRFYAWFGKGAADKDGLAACKELKGLISGRDCSAPGASARVVTATAAPLSAERVWREIVKLLAAENSAPAWTLMKETGVLDEVLPEAGNIKRLEMLLKAETKYEMPPAPLVRLAALLPEGKASAEIIAAKLKLSNREAEKITALATLPALLRGKLDPVPFRRALYEHGADACRDAALLIGAENPTLDLEPVLAEALGWERPVFPVMGVDLLKLGAKPGPKMGEILRSVEEWWIAQDFRPSREECLAEARRLTR
jgi:poly(A) polymerase